MLAGNHVSLLYTNKRSCSFHKKKELFTLSVVFYVLRTMTTVPLTKSQWLKRKRTTCQEEFKDHKLIKAKSWIAKRFIKSVGGGFPNIPLLPCCERQEVCQYFFEAMENVYSIKVCQYFWKQWRKSNMAGSGFAPRRTLDTTI